MSLKVDTSDPKKLTENERRYLQDRGMLPQGVERVRDGQYQPFVEFVHVGTANTGGMTAEELDAKLARLAELEAREAKTNLAKDQASFAREGSPLAGEEDRPYTYTEEDEDQLKAELDKRGLDTNGDRKTLRSRLVKDDKARAKGSS